MRDFKKPINPLSKENHKNIPLFIEFYLKSSITKFACVIESEMKGFVAGL